MPDGAPFLMTVYCETPSTDVKYVLVRFLAVGLQAVRYIARFGPCQAPHNVAGIQVSCIWCSQHQR